MDIDVTAHACMHGTRESVWSVVSDLKRFPSFFDGFFLIPGVNQVDVLYDEPIPGGKRKIHNSDGSILEEELIVLTPYREHRYRLCSGFTVPFSWMIHGAEATWLCVPHEGKGIDVSWNYRFHVRSVILAPLTYIVITLLFSRAMQRCLDAMSVAVTEESTT